MRFFDCHNDYLTELSDKQAKKYVLKLDNENKVISAVWTTKLNEKQSLNLLKFGFDLQYFGKTKISIEDCHFITPQNLIDVINLKPVYAGLVWNNDNQFGGGANGISSLSEDGKFLVKALEENNIIVDLAHSNEKTFYDIARISNKPLFCSHTALNAFKNHNRNLKDYQIKMVIESRGFIGLTFVSEFLTDKKQAKIRDFCDEIIYFVSKYGTSNIGIGSDFYGSKNLVSGINSYNSFKKISKQLLKLGMSYNEIDCLFYKNLETYLKNNLIFS